MVLDSGILATQAQLPDNPFDLVSTEDLVAELVRRHDRAAVLLYSEKPDGVHAKQFLFPARDTRAHQWIVYQLIEHVNEIANDG